MVNSDKVVLVLLDAFRSDYISKKNTPFLHNLAMNNIFYEKLIPSFGFCERTEILVGLTPLESECFTAFGFNPSASPYREYKNLFIFLDGVESLLKIKIFSKIIRRLLWIYFRGKKDSFFPFNIPLKMLPTLCLTEDGHRNHIENNNLSIYKIARNVFDEASTSMSKYLNGDDLHRLDQIIENINSDHDFFPLYISELDVTGHEFGPFSPEVYRSLRKVDSLLKDFYEKLLARSQNLTIVFCGDHGMTKVSKKINILKEISQFEKETLTSKKFRYFVDSTMCRFWVKNLKNSEIKSLKEKILQSYSEYGFFVDRTKYRFHGIPDSDFYGDLIFICHEGILLSPDFFNSENKHIKGMHGYEPKNINHYGFGIVASYHNKQAHFKKVTPLTEIYKDLRSIFKL